MVELLVQSLAPSTLVRYYGIVRSAEELMGTAFKTWLPFTTAFVHEYVALILKKGLSASTVN